MSGDTCFKLQLMFTAYRVSCGYKESLMSKGYNRSGWCDLLSDITVLALFAIGVIAMTGILPTAAASWIAIGLGSASIIVKLIGTDTEKGKVDLIVTLISSTFMLTMAVLSTSGLLTAQQMGIGLVGAAVAHGLFFFSRKVKFYLTYNAEAHDILHLD